MSENEKKEEIKENVPIINNDKTTDIINSINATKIPNIEEVSNKSTTDENYSIQKNNNENYFAQNQMLSNNNNENNITNINNNQNINNINNNQNNININTQLNEEINVNNNINNKETIFNNNNINLFSNQNNYNNNIYMNSNSNANNSNEMNLNQNKLNINQMISQPQNNLGQNFQPPIGKNLNRKKSNAEKKSGQKGMKDLAFLFPLKDSLSKIEIPFSFSQNLDEPNGNSRFHTYITIKDTPKLHIDISDEPKKVKFERISDIDSLKKTNEDLKKKLVGIDSKNMNYEKENEDLRNEIDKIKNEIISKNNDSNNLKLSIQQISKESSRYEGEINKKINEKNNSYTQIKEQYDKIKNEIANKQLDEKQQKEYLSKINEEINKIQKEYQNNFKYYNNKLMNNKYKNEYIKKSLQKDLLDFTSYVTQKIQIISPKVKELINYIQNAVDNSIGNDYEVKLYGSHATGLCLPWSDIDVVLCKKSGEASDNNSYMPLHDLFTYLQKKNDLFKSINYIGTTTVPLIKIKTKENIGIQSVDISLQDKTHYGIKCVSLVLSYKKDYEVLLPMILALKNILKQANLNDPYKVRKNIIIDIIIFILFIIIGWTKFIWLSSFSCSFFKITKRAR